MKKIEMKKKFTLPGWLFVAIMAVYCELLLHFWTAKNLMAGRVVVVALFAMGFGVALGLISSFFKAKVSKGVVVGIGIVLAVLYMTEYFLQDAYQNFMTIKTIISGAGGVAQDYFALVVSLVTRNLWRIALVLLPVIGYGLFCINPESSWKLRGILAAAAAALYLLGFGAMNALTNDASVMNSTYNFDSAVRVFGLHMGLILESTGSGKADTEPEFVAPTMPTVAVPETESTEPAAEGTEATEPPVVYGDNALDLDFSSLTTAGSIGTINQYIASQTPSKQNEYTGLFEGKNLILITAEAFTAEVIDPELTPTLYRLATKGIHFTDYYQPAWGASTTSGEFSNVIGLVPAGGGSCMMEAAEQKLFLTMGHQLQKLGYYSTAYHNHFHDFYNRHKTHKHLGYDRFIARNMGMDEIKPVWPESDLQMMELTIDQYIDHQPFSIYYMTVSGHCPYVYSENAMTRKNIEVIEQMESMSGYSDVIQGYFASQLELEYALTYLVERLEEAGIADDTVIVLGTDHYPYGLENSSTWNNTKDYLAELFGKKANDCFTRDHNALIIWSGCIEDMGLRIDDPVYSLDILPTLSNLFGVEYDSRLLVGRDVFSDELPVVLWPNHSWKTDKGSYNFSAGTFTPAEGVEVEEGYIEYVSSVVRNKITYSRSALENNYFNYLYRLMNAE